MSTMNQDRRAFLYALAAGVGSISLLGGCKRKAFTCNEPSKLSETARNVRANVKYVDKTPIKGKTCEVCSRYRDPKSGDGCGTCTAFAGPVHPDGYCKLWVHK